MALYVPLLPPKKPGSKEAGAEAERNVKGYELGLSTCSIEIKTPQKINTESYQYILMMLIQYY